SSATGTGAQFAQDAPGRYRLCDSQWTRRIGQTAEPSIPNVPVRSAVLSEAATSFMPPCSSAHYHAFRHSWRQAMAVLIVLFGSFLVYRLLGFAGVAMLDSWIVSARIALATMFVFTALAHFTRMKNDLIAMVPPALPRPDLLVFATGV